MPAAKSKKRPSRKKPKPEDALPPVHDWRTTDEDEVLKRKIRARDESFTVQNEERDYPVQGTFAVTSGGSGGSALAAGEDARGRYG